MEADHITEKGAVALLFQYEILEFFAAKAAKLQ
jgi:hypothetical protein